MLQAHLNQMIRASLTAQPQLSDILATPGAPLQAAVHGKLEPVAGGILTPFQTEAMVLCLIGKDRRLLTDFLETGSSDFSYSPPGLARFRVNVFQRLGSLGLVMRRLPTKTPTIESLKLPRVFEALAGERQGLALVTGASGSGKSTSLAALVDRINEQRSVHIVTLEDPVEFLHRNKKATISQRELGMDFSDFASGLRAALRQAPGVILVGEIRDRETMETALQAAETGHLVLGTLHTADAVQTISRILGMYEAAEERLVRLRLATCLKATLSQRLLPRVGGGRIAVFEILRNTLRTREVILHGESQDKTFYSIMEDGEASGMSTFDRNLADLFQQGLVEEEQALLTATDRAALGKHLDRIRKERGEVVSNIKGLEIDSEYHEKQSRSKRRAERKDG